MDNAEQPAQPIIDDCISTHNQEIFYGLTKREYFAGLALQAYVSGNFAWSDGLDGGSVYAGADECASEAVAYADALLKALEDNK